MAELTTAETAGDPCCAPEQQASCCEPSAKADCCGHEDGCGCAAGSEPTQPTDVRRVVPTGKAHGLDLPMAPVCALDETGLRSQLERYRQAGRNARLIERTPRRLVAELDTNVDAELVAQTIAVERECCSFFALTWQPDRQRLIISVSDAVHEPALDAIASALNL